MNCSIALKAEAKAEKQAEAEKTPEVKPEAKAEKPDVPDVADADVHRAGTRNAFHPQGAVRRRLHQGQIARVNLRVNLPKQFHVFSSLSSTGAAGFRGGRAVLPDGELPGG